jgi:mannan endo-1,4-beta-mannosidase
MKKVGCFLSCMMFCLAACYAETVTLSPLAVRKRAILDLLATAASSPNLVIGQNAGHAEAITSTNYFTNLRAQTGRYPALLGIDLGIGDLAHLTDAAGRAQVIESLVRWQENGGLVTLSMHPASPTTLTNTWVEASNQLVTNPAAILSAGTPERTAWLAMLDRVAVVLGELQDAGVIVLWRPLHEMNGAWFWWGKWPDPAAFVALWHDMHNYFTQTKKLDNLLWVYCANAVDWPDSVAPTAAYWPGDAYVDLTALDFYGETAADFGKNSGYADLIATGKTLAFGELGPKAKRDGGFDNLTYLAIKGLYPELAGMLAWHSWTSGTDFVHVAIEDCSNAAALLSDSRAITLEKTGLR